MPRAALLSSLLALAAGGALAQQTRGLDAHEHGVGTLDVAVEGSRIAMVLEAPGFDIVGFEREAESDQDRAAVEAALDRLRDPTTLFAVPEAAACTVASAEASLVGEDHDDHGDEHDEGHVDHDHDDHDDHAEEGGGHTEFRASYMLDCEDVSAIGSIGLPYFDLFPNARALDVQLVTDAGATAVEVTREAPELALE